MSELQILQNNRGGKIFHITLAEFLANPHGFDRIRVNTRTSSTTYADNVYDTASLFRSRDIPVLYLENCLGARVPYRLLSETIQVCFIEEGELVTAYCAFEVEPGQELILHCYRSEYVEAHAEKHHDGNILTWAVA